MGFQQQSYENFSNYHWIMGILEGYLANDYQELKVVVVLN